MATISSPLLSQYRSEPNYTESEVHNRSRQLSATETSDASGLFKRRSILYSFSGVEDMRRIGVLGVCFIAYFNVSRASVVL